MDIKSGTGWPASALSNFTPHSFPFEGARIASMEGFLQGLKFKSPGVQFYTFNMVGAAAKFKGKKQIWQDTQTLWYRAKPIKRDSQEYQDLLDRVFWKKFTHNADAKAALLATGDEPLTHAIGCPIMEKTVLTEEEFVSRLMNIRAKLREQEAENEEVED